MSKTVGKTRRSGQTSSKYAFPKQDTQKTINCEPIKKSIDIPLWAYCNDEYFEVVNTNNMDFEKMYPFDKDALLASSSLETEDLIKIADKYKAQPPVPLPKWQLDIHENEMNLRFDYPKKLFEEPITTQTNFLSMIQPGSENKLDLSIINREKEPFNNQTSTKSMPVSIRKAEKGKFIVENLEISSETKRLILEKYYRGKNHSDLKRVKAVDKVFSSILYELFSKVYKEKPIIEISEIVKDRDTEKYIAYHIFNNEKLTTGIGQSKKLAKSEASFKSLQIFAPSLVEETEKQIEAFDKGHNIEEISEFQFIKSTKAINQGGIHFNSSTGIETDSHFMKSAHHKHHNDLSHNSILNTEDDVKRSHFKIRGDYSNVQGNGGYKIEENKTNQTFLESATPENLAIEFSQAFANAIKDPANMTRFFTFYQVYTDLLNFAIKEEQDLKKRLENKQSLEIEDPVNYYCTNKIFTKLYLLHSLLNKKGRSFPLINCVQVGTVFNVYLHYPELKKNYIYQSGSYELGVEMTKQQLMFELYPTCLGLMDILEEMKSKYEEEKARIMNKEEKGSQFYKSVCQKRFSNWNNYGDRSGQNKDNWDGIRENSFKQRNGPQLKYTYNKFNRYHKGRYQGRNNSFDAIHKKAKFFG